MLVAGKAETGNEQVERFVQVINSLLNLILMHYNKCMVKCIVIICFYQIFDGVSRLAVVYQKICDAGSILFNFFHIVFYCDKTKRDNTKVMFGKSTELEQFSCIDDVMEQITEVCAFMDDCLQEWNKHIAVKRTEFYFLNHFTTAQLVILRKEVRSQQR